MSCLIEEFEPIFGEAKVDSSGLDPTRWNPFLFYVHAPDSFHLNIIVTDFRSSTWEAVLSVMQLEDMVCFYFFPLILSFFWILFFIGINF